MAEAVRSILSLDYPEFEVIVINDRIDRQHAASVLATEFQLGAARGDRSPQHPVEAGVDPRPSTRRPPSPNLAVIDKEHGGKSDALNAGINVSRYPLFCTIDADAMFQQNALLRAVRPFLEDPERVIAVGGQVRVANGCRVVRHRVGRAAASARAFSPPSRWSSTSRVRRRAASGSRP